MFTATYPASFRPEENGKGFHVRFPDLPEALTGGTDLADTQEQAVDCLAEALAGRIVRGDAIPDPSKLKRVSIQSAFRSIWHPSWHSTWQCGRVDFGTRTWPSASALA